MFSLRVFLLLATVLLIVGFGGCERPSSKTPKETFVGPLEKTVRLMMKSGRTLNSGFETIKENLKGVASFIPVFNTFADKRSTVSNALNPHKSKIKLIFPGTVWCGDGDISSNKNDLGLFKRTDACCKAHDSCPDGIPAREERDGLVNNGIFTRSSCECDSEFYNCLKEVNSVIATDIGTTYFNVLRPQCFKQYYPIVGCKKYGGHRLLNDKCEEYIYNTTQPETMQWFDNPDFFVI